MKSDRTYQQIETAKDRAVRFTKNVLHNDDRADEIADESVEDYAARRKLRIVNNPVSLSALTAVRDLLDFVDHSPTSRKKTNPMSTTNTNTKAELQETVNEVADKISEMLDPALDRKEIVEKLQELDEMLNGSDDDDDADDDADDESDEN